MNHKVHEIGLRARLLHFLEYPISWDGKHQSECEECATRSKDLDCAICGDGNRCTVLPHGNRQTGFAHDDSWHPIRILLMC